MVNLIIVEVGYNEQKTPLYQFYSKLSNGTYRCVTALPDGKGNTPMLVKDARARVAQMNSIVRYGSSMEEEE